MLGVPFALFKVGLTITGHRWLDCRCCPRRGWIATNTRPSTRRALASRIWWSIRRGIGERVVARIWRLISVRSDTDGRSWCLAGGWGITCCACDVGHQYAALCLCDHRPLAAAQSPVECRGLRTGVFDGGTATNVATLGAIYRGFGGRIFGVYLGTIIIGSIGFGMALITTCSP